MKTIKIKIVLILGSKNPLTDLIVQKSLKMMDEIIFLVRTATQTHAHKTIHSFLSPNSRIRSDYSQEATGPLHG